LLHKTIEVLDVLRSQRGLTGNSPGKKKLKDLQENAHIPLTRDWEIPVNHHIDPMQYGWKKNSEYVALDWVAATTAVYLLFGFLPVDRLIQFLRAINYHGLFEIGDILKEPDIQRFNEYQKFSYFKAIAKYYKSKGDLDQAQRYYRTAIRVAIDNPVTDLVPYSLVLLAKLYSDYSQRKGLFDAFTEIAYSRIKNNLIPSNELLESKYQICADSYAKEIYTKNLKEGEMIYAKLLSRKHLSKDHLCRIRFRLLESRINYCLQHNTLTQLETYIQNYKSLLRKVRDNPKALYIRQIQFISLYRRVLEHRDTTGTRAKRGRTLLNRDHIMEILEEAISSCKKYRDRKFLAQAYFEKSFWHEKTGSKDILDLRIASLLDSYASLHNEDKSTIVNSTYIKVVEELGRLYVQKENWTQAVNYYNMLYDYLFYLTNTLEEDQKVINKFIEDRPYVDVGKHPEYEYLSLEELHLIKERMISDYTILTTRLISNSDSIRSIQKQNINHIIELIHTNNQLLIHDLTSHLNDIQTKVDDFGMNDHPGSKAWAGSIRDEIKLAKKSISNYEKITVHKIVSPTVVDISKEIANYRLLARERFGNKVKIEFQNTNSTIKETFLEFLIFRILDNLIANAIEVGRRNGHPQVDISIQLLQQPDYLYLCVFDNCGDFLFFEAVIRNLNDHIPVKSKKADTGGNGIQYLKQLLAQFNKSAPWEVARMENEIKMLKIPLIKYID